MRIRSFSGAGAETDFSKNNHVSEGLFGLIIGRLSMILVSADRPEEAIELLNRAIRLNPIPPAWYFVWLGAASAMLQRHDEAIAAYKKALRKAGLK